MKDIYVDIDNTICRTKGMDYENSVPIYENIEKVNKLYDTGEYTITYWTARGQKTGINWLHVTLEQFKKWNVKYHNLKLTKPPFDILIDDKVINSIWDWSQDSFDKVVHPPKTNV